MTASALPRAGDAVRRQALETLLSSDLEPIVDLVAWMAEPGSYHVASAEGEMRFRRKETRTAKREPRWSFDPETLWGRDPLACQDPLRFGSLAEERSMPHPRRGDNSYPHAFDHLSQIFDHPSAPDLLVQHSAAHYWGDQGGHIGEHGSLGVVQARAPFIAAGAGIRADRMVDRTCRLVDVAPTVLALLGGRPLAATEPGSLLAVQDGVVLDDLLTGSGASHVVVMLWDGTNANVLYDLAERGLAPSVARLMDMGTTYRGGAIASMPTVTLANHTTILTGSHPGHHGILHNAWIDRATGAQVVTNSPSTWSTSMQWLRPGVETVHHAVHRFFPGSVSVSINEPCDAGADYSIFELMRNGEAIDRPPPADEIPDATQRFVRPSKDFRWSSLVDHTAPEQFIGVWSGEYRGRPWPTPTFTWVNFTLTDSAFHEGGPYSDIAAAGVRDTDARVGRMLDAVERAGVWESTAFLLVADHGMQQANPAVTGDWDVALADAGVGVRDEGYGFLYLGDI